jgi:GNAT superfamily N-acetyltransferase
MRALRRTTGAHPTAGGFGELRRLLQDLPPADMAVLDASFGAWAARPFGRELLAGLILPLAGSVIVELLNIEPAGLVVLERGYLAARVSALAVASDLRRRGIARTLLMDADAAARERGIRWLYARVPSVDGVATRFALACGFQRYRPQYLQRLRPGALPVTNTDVRVEFLDAREAIDSAARWHDYEVQVGDEWCADLARADLRPPPLKQSDACCLCIVGDHAVGLATVHVAGGAAQVTLWLDADIWGQPLEVRVLKAVVDSLHAAPDHIDLHLGSSAHLRASIEIYRRLGFAPIVSEVVTFVREVSIVAPDRVARLDDASAPDDGLSGDEGSNIKAEAGGIVGRLRRLRLFSTIRRAK